MVKKKKQQMNYQFGTALQSLETAVRAGYSMENAIRECRKDLQRIYGQENDLVREFLYMEAQMEVGIPVETLFLDLGERSHLEDIRNFGEVFAIAKRTGGDLAGIMEQTSQVLGEKIRVKQEIDVSIAGKKMEQTIMSLVPGAIILYMQISSGSFLDILYHNAAGAGVMTGCLVVYLFGWRMGKKIVDIEV
ncbi:MAG: type II secretion system F family protein [Clostridiales bacterium]|nr:type II secretion system F family protein [Clostridiales bacterium]